LLDAPTANANADDDMAANTPKTTTFFGRFESPGAFIQYQH